MTMSCYGSTESVRDQLSLAQVGRFYSASPFSVSDTKALCAPLQLHHWGGGRGSSSTEPQPGYLNWGRSSLKLTWRRKSSENVFMELLSLRVEDEINRHVKAHLCFTLKSISDIEVAFQTPSALIFSHIWVCYQIIYGEMDETEQKYCKAWTFCTTKTKKKLKKLHPCDV